MSTKRAKTTASVGSKGKDPKESESSAGSVAVHGHPDDICPLTLTSATQELFGCRYDGDVTRDNPYKILRKEDILQDLRNRAAVSDFSPVKQLVLAYPEDELLLVYDRDFIYGSSFYLVLTVEGKDRHLMPIVAEVGEEALEREPSDVFAAQKTPEPRPWISLGSEQEIEEESVTDSRPRLKCRISRVRRAFGAPVFFSDRNAAETKDGFIECTPYQDKIFSLKQMERHCGVQAIPNCNSSSTQTPWTYPKNMCTQYEPREFSKEEKENCLQSEELKHFISLAVSRLEVAIQQNEIADVFFDDWKALSEDDGGYAGKADSHLKEYQSFTDLHFSQEKTISNISWHPTISGVIAVAMTERLSFEDRINASTKLLLNPSLILFWSFSDPINPQLLLECPDDVFSFEFCPSDPNIIVGSCMNGQVVLWDISAHVERLQGTRSSGGKNIAINTNPLQVFEDTRDNETSVVRYCAVSSIEHGHKAPVTDIQWLPETFEVSRMGVPMENKSGMCVQIVTCAPDCCLMFWDIRAPRVAFQNMADQRKQKVEEKPLENPDGVPNTFKHLNLTWKPLFRVSLPKIDTSGEYSPLKFSLRDNTCDNHPGCSAERAHLNAELSEVAPEYSQLRVPSAKQHKPLKGISTKFYAGTEDGELVYTDWKLEKDDSGRLFSVKPSHRFTIHDGLVNTVRRSPFFKDIVLTVGGWTFAIWKEGVMNGPIIHSSCSQRKCTVGYWSQSRPAVFYIGKEDGNLEVWDLLEKTHEPSQTQNITTAPITCIKPWIISSKQHLLAVSDHLGTLHILEIPWTLRSPCSNEKLSVNKYFEKEVDRLVYFDKRREMRTKEKKNMDAEELRKKMEPNLQEKEEKQILEEAKKEYEDYLSLEKVILKDMGLLPDPDETAEI
ncbi:WD repeat-containing protein 63 [Esox lucius]|uniref:WD repeat domain 63 n=1 Tax=Esox lucius TaxID=8010 RepID=A0A3P9AMY2_ESOLU|nr:WD repeat-containing protein 63 [Esox lucius]XP_019904850.2 WD repeat-containing protein 63 [Esox lucius]XP_019904851.2 WD repeat-containing protein 63 [Esox lucius]XP_019904852.2 WD repeat-containing protein 63 [Esox lucius]